MEGNQHLHAIFKQDYSIRRCACVYQLCKLSSVMRTRPNTELLNVLQLILCGSILGCLIPARNVTSFSFNLAIFLTTFRNISKSMFLLPLHTYPSRFQYHNSGSKGGISRTNQGHFLKSPFLFSRIS